MGLLDKLYELQARGEKFRTEARAGVAEKFGIRAEDRERARLRKDQAEQGVGLAQQFARMGMGPDQPVLDEATGRYNTPMDPTAAAAVGLMQNPGSRGLGLQLGANLLDPQAQQALATSRQQESTSRSAQQATGLGNMLDALRFKAGERDADRNYRLDQARTTAQIRASEAAARGNEAEANQLRMTGGLSVDQWLNRGAETKAVSEAIGAGGKMLGILDQYGNVGKIISPQARAQLEVGVFNMIPALQKALNAGGQNALGTEEREYLEDFLGNPGQFLVRPEVTASRLRGIVERLQSDHDYRRATMPFLPGVSFEIPSYDLPAGLELIGPQQPQPRLTPQDEALGSGQPLSFAAPGLEWGRP